MTSNALNRLCINLYINKRYSIMKNEKYKIPEMDNDIFLVIYKDGTMKSVSVPKKH